jgi:hypothetical protein
MKRWLAVFLLIASPAVADDKIDLKLVGKPELGPLLTQGCSALLWQANRDRDKDRYAYVFRERLAADHAREPALIRIGDADIAFRRIAIGGRDKGYRMFETQLYKSTTGDYTAILELKVEDEMGEAVEISGGTMTIVTPGKPPFRLNIKGGVGCITAAAPPPPPPPQAAPSTPSSAEGMFRRYQVRPNQVPRTLLADAQKRYECKPDVMSSPVTAFQLSEESAVWQLQCDRFAYNTSSVFVIVHAERPQEYTFIGFAAPPGRKRDQPFILINGQWNERERTITSFALGRGMGDCGTYEVHRLAADARFRLVEFREKENCDGKETPPQQYKLVFPAR